MLYRPESTLGCRMLPVYRRIVIAVILLVGVFLYGTLGHYFLLYPEYSVLHCAFRTIVMLGTINEAFDPRELAQLNTPYFKMFMLSMVIFGTSVILYALSVITAFFVEGELQQLLRHRKMSREISKFTDHFIICGAGETGHYIAEELRAAGRQFVLVEKDHERIERLMEEELPYVEGDASDEEVLDRAGIQRARGLAVALPTDRENLYVTITARQLNPKLRIISKGIEHNVDRKLQAAGATKVVRPNHIGGMRMASELIRPVATTFIDRMLHDPDDPTRIDEICIPEGSSMAGQTLAESRFRQKTGLQVVAVKPADSHRFDYDPKPDTRLVVGTVLVVIGRTNDVAHARSLVEGS